MSMPLVVTLCSQVFTPLQTALNLESSQTVHKVVYTCLQIFLKKCRHFFEDAVL